MKFLSPWVPAFKQLKTLLLVFILAFLAALTAAHPAFFVNDEMITGNQLAQLNSGHQVIVSEGKFGVFKDGTPFGYFAIRNNYLGYPLFLPMVSLPAEKLVYFFGDHFIFVITYLWTFFIIGLALLLNEYFPGFTQIGKWRWTSGLIVVAFAGLFLNLWAYVPFPLTGENAAPEIMAIVFTNIVLFALLSVTIYGILQMIFRDPAFAFFGTVVCISCSSYFFWSSFCKDHVLVALLFAVVLLLTLKFLYNEMIWSLAGSFFITGLLVWARPELGSFIFLALFLILLVTLLLKRRISDHPIRRWYIFLCPLFTIIGAVPFFVNNYMTTGNIFLPAFVQAMNAGAIPTASLEQSPGSSQIIPDTIHSLLQANQLTTLTPLSSFPSDLFGILVAPLSGSMGVLPLVPVFICAVFILPILIIKKDLFNAREKMTVSVLILFSLAIFGAYINRAYGLNVDPGIIPDIRYLSPLYMTLTIAGLVILKKARGILDKPLELLSWIVAVWVAVLPLALVLVIMNRPVFLDLENVFSLLNFWITVSIFILVSLFAVLYYCSVHQGRFAIHGNLLKGLLAAICAIPLIWQVNASFISFLFLHSWGSYYYWLPSLFRLFNLIL